MSEQEESIEVEDVQVNDLQVETITEEGEKSITVMETVEYSDLGQSETKQEETITKKEEVTIQVVTKEIHVIGNRVEVQVTSESVGNESKDDKTSVEGNADKPKLKVYATKRDESVDLRRPADADSSSIEGQPSLTVIEKFEEVVEKYPNIIAMREECNGEWKTWTYTQYRQDSMTAAKSFIQLGLEPYNSVGIIGFNSSEWLISNLGAIYACGLSTGIYATNTAETCLFVASDAKTNIIVAENDIHVQKFLKIWDKMPFLKAIVQYKGELKEKRENLYTWNEFMEMGRNADDVALKERISMLKPDRCCSLIYTSGTTGNPKGVMLSHDNITYGTKLLELSVKFHVEKYPEHDVVSYLPLSHIAAQIVDIYGAFVFHATVTFAKPDALKGTLRDTLRAVHPTLFLGVPRVFEKIEEGLKHLGQSMTGVKKRLGTWAKGVALKANVNKEKGHSTPFGFMIAERLLRKIKVQLGLDKCLVFTAAAPISLETLRYFQSINIPLMEIYGMSECAGCASISLPGSLRTTSVGKALPHTELKIFNEDEDGNGEICMRGRYVFMGYLENEEKTKEAIDEDGWLHSGDLGKFDDDGFLYITGRIKELIITAGGENIAPIPIEGHIKAELPFISNAMVIGDKRKFLSVLLTPKILMDKDTGGPTSQLSDITKSYCETIGLNVSEVSEIAPTTPEVLDKEIKAGIARANQYAISRAGSVQKYIMLPSDFSIVTGELGPTLKLRRPQVMKMYKEMIDKIYDTA
eukprot:gene9864-10874_t